MLEIFEHIKHFRPSEFDYPEKIDPFSLQLLDAMRDQEGKRRGIIITVNADFAYSGHAPNSWHYKGKAFDIVIRDARTGRPLPVMKQFIIAMHYPWGGVGFYPYWNDPGIHVDTRPLGVFQRKATWWRDEKGEYKPYP